MRELSGLVYLLVSSSEKILVVLLFWLDHARKIRVEFSFGQTGENIQGEFSLGENI